MRNQLCLKDELQRILIYEDKNRGCVKKISKILGKAEPTIRDIINGRIKYSVEFLKAAFFVTKDPEIKAALEPDGWELYKKVKNTPLSNDLNSEMNDVFIAASNLVASIKEAIKDGVVVRNELKALMRLKMQLTKEIDEVMSIVQKMSNDGLLVSVHPII